MSLSSTTDAAGRLFPLEGGPWQVVRRTDVVVNALADRHYSRREVGNGRVGGPCHVLVLRAVDRSAGWVTAYTLHPDDGLDAWRCAMFRNEGARLSSELILEAMATTAAVWGAPPADGWATYVDPARVRSSNPGYCFKRAGWYLDREYRPGPRRRGMVRLRA